MIYNGIKSTCLYMCIECINLSTRIYLISDKVSFTKSAYEVDENEILQVVLSLDKPYTTDIDVTVDITTDPSEGKHPNRGGELHQYSVY